MVASLAAGIAVLAAYLSLGTLLALYYRRRLVGGESDFYIARGRLGGFLSAMTYAATTYSSFMIVGLVGFVYNTGVGAFGFELVYFVGTLALLTLFAQRVWALSRERGWVTPGDMVADLYGSRLPAIVAGIVYLVSLVPYASVQLKGIGEAFSGLGGSPGLYTVGVLFGSTVMIVWILIAGIWSIAVTDAIQGIWMLAAALVLLAWLASVVYSGGVSLTDALNYMGSEGFRGPGEFWSLPVFLAFTVPWLFFAVTNPQVLQRLFMPRDRSSLASMIKLYALFGISYTILVTLIGIIARAANHAGLLELGSGLRNDEVTPAILAIANPLLASIVFTSIIAASVSTADSIILTLASTTSRDVVRPRDERARLLIGYATAAGILVAMGALAWKRVGFIVLLSVLSSLMLLSLAPPIIAAWLGARGDPRLVSAAMAVGPLTVTLAAWANGWDPLATFLERIMGVPISIIILLSSTILTLIAHYYREIREPLKRGERR